MNNDILPAGTWSWLESLGYSRADVERITEQRRLRPKPAVEEGKELPGGSMSGIWPMHDMEAMGEQIVENLRESDAVAERMIDEDVIGELTKLEQFPAWRCPDELRGLRAVLMSRSEQNYRRQEGWMIHLAWTDPVRFEEMRPVAEDILA